jgi:hypothetical protein
MRLVRLIRIIFIIQCKIRIGREVCQMPMAKIMVDSALSLHARKRDASIGCTV